MSSNVYKAVILVGGPQKGTRFRPLSLECPKPLFPIAGRPTIQHHVQQLSKVVGLREILIVGFYQPAEIEPFVVEMQRSFGATLRIRYLQEFAPLGTAGGLHHFRDQLLVGSPSGVFVLNADVCGDLPFEELAQFVQHTQRTQPDGDKAVCAMLVTEATRDQSVHYGCAVVEEGTGAVLHYVEKPKTFVSKLISCGVYLFTKDIFPILKEVFTERANDAAIYANRHCLALYARTDAQLLSASGDQGPEIIGDVFIHESARVHPTAKIGPNVSIGRNVRVAAGARIREAIVLDDANIQEHSCILWTIVGWRCAVGAWARVEGAPIGPNPNTPFAKLENKPLFKRDGRLNPNITILGCGVHVPRVWDRPQGDHHPAVDSAAAQGARRVLY